MCRRFIGGGVTMGRGGVKRGVVIGAGVEISDGVDSDGVKGLVGNGPRGDRWAGGTKGACVAAGDETGAPVTDGVSSVPGVACSIFPGGAVF